MRYLKTPSPDGIPIFLAIRNRCIVVCASRPPRRLPPRFPRRFSRRLPIVPSVCRSHQLHTARAAFSERLSCRFRDVVPVRPSYRLLIAHAHVYHLRLPHRFVPFYRLALPHHLTPSTSPNGPSRYCGGSTVSSHGSAMGEKGEPDMPDRRGSARLTMAPAGYAGCRTVCPFPQVIGAADTRY